MARDEPAAPGSGSGVGGEKCESAGRSVGHEARIQDGIDESRKCPKADRAVRPWIPSLDSRAFRIHNGALMRRVFYALFAIVVAGLLAAGWYAYQKGFTKKWRGFVATEFRKRGVELTLRKLTLHPLRGIIAKEVKVYDTSDRRRTMAVIDEMRLVINWANLIQKKTFIDALDLRDAKLSLPIDPQNSRGPKIEITKLSGRLMLPPQQVYLSNFEAELYGIRVAASGRIINPQKAASIFRPRKEKPEHKPTDQIAQILDELRRLKYDSTTPQLDLRFSGDLAHPESVFVEARLWAERVRRDHWRLESVYLDALYRDERFALRQLSVSDAKGELRLTGSYDPVAKGLEVQIHSTLDPQPTVKAFGRVSQLEEFVFYEPPTINLTVRAAFGDSPEAQAIGRISAKRFGLRSVLFDQFDADLVYQGDRWAARGVRLVHQSGEITGDVMQIPNDFRTRLRSTINPEVLAPLLTGSTAEWFKQFDFIDAPSVHIEARGPSPDPQKLWANGVLKLGRSTYRGVTAQSATATVRYNDQRMTVDPLRVVRPEGVGEGGLIFDFARDEVVVQRVRTTINPHDMIWWIDPKLVKDIAPYRFGKRPPQLYIDGLVHTKGGDSTKLRIDLTAPGGMNYTFLKKDLHCPQISAHLLFTKDRLRIDDFEGALFGGRLVGDLDISLSKEKPAHKASLRLEKVDFASLTKLYFNYDTSKGHVDAYYNFSGKGDDSRAMRGQGQLTVTDGAVFAIPFLGPLSGILNGIVPGMGDDVARRGSASFDIANGTIATKDFVIEGRGFSMIGAGDLYFLDDAMNFDVRINARGLPGVLLFPVSKLFEYTSTDSLSKPNWRPKVIPRL
jgi:hypothetical protein